MTVREEFEAWVRHNVGQLDFGGYHTDGGRWFYRHNFIRMCWDAWQAALATQQKPARSLEWLESASEDLAAQQKDEPSTWSNLVEQRLLSWRQSFVNRSGDQLALDDLMDKQSLDDLIDFVCSAPPAQQKADYIHTCSYYCNRPACIKAQRDELRDRFEAQQKAEPVLWVERRLEDGAFESVPDVREAKPDIDPGDGWEWIALYAAPPLDPEGIRLLQGAKRNHRYFDTAGDTTSCPAADELGPCDCGADEWNARIDAYLAKYPGA